jgi:hypothetical protein
MKNVTGLLRKRGEEKFFPKIQKRKKLLPWVFQLPGSNIIILVNIRLDRLQM